MVISIAVALFIALPADGIEPQLVRHGRTATAKPLEAARLAPFPSTSAIRTYHWEEGAIYRLVATPGEVSDIALEPGEKLISVASGDTAQWMVGDTKSGSGENSQVHLLVKPVRSSLSTNLVIATDRRVYHLRIESRPSSAMAGIRWTYSAAHSLMALKGKEHEEAPSDPSPDLSRLNFSYTISGQAEWRPIRVFDDGRRTYIEFPASLEHREAPPLFLCGSDGVPELINYRVRGRYYLVDRLLASAELRLGEKQQQYVRIARMDQAGKPCRRGKSS